MHTELHVLHNYKTVVFFPLRHTTEALQPFQLFFFQTLAHISEFINDREGEREEGKQLILNGMHKRSGDKDTLTDIA